LSKRKYQQKLEERQSWVDQQLRKAIGDGDVSHLPGSGKPLARDDDPNTPAEMRSAYKIMKDNDLLPDWIMLNREIEQGREAIMVQLRAALNEWQKRKRRARTPRALQKAEDNWHLAKGELQTATDQLNRKILSYNLKVPNGVRHQTPLDLDWEIKRLSDI